MLPVRYLFMFLLIFIVPTRVGAENVSFVLIKGLQTGYLSTISGCALDPGTGHLVVCGYFAKTIGFDGADIDPIETQGSAADACVFKIDSQGQVVWAKQAGGSEVDHATKVAVHAQGDIYMTGRFLDQATFGQQGGNEQVLEGSDQDNIAFVSKFDANGSLQWAKAINGPDMSSGFDVCVDSADGVYAVGTFWGTSLFPGDKTMSNGPDGYLVKLNAQTAEPEWQIPIGGDTLDQTTAVDIGPNNRVYVAGLQGDVLFVQARDAQSGVQASEFSEIQIHLGISAYHPDIAVGVDGRVYVTGSFNGTKTFGDVQLNSQGGTDIFVAGFSQKGDQLFATSMGSQGDDVGRSLTVDTTGMLRVAGEINGTIQWEDQIIGQAGSTEAVVMVCDSNDGQIVKMDATSGQTGKERRARDIVADEEKGYIVGDFEQSLLWGEQKISTVASNKAGFWAVMDQLDTCKLSFAQGWSLSSLCREPEDISVQAIFSGIQDSLSSVWRWQKNNWSVYLPQLENEAALDYVQTKGFDLLEELPYGQGFWVNVENKSAIHVIGSNQVQGLNPQPGWNLLGLTGEGAQSIASLLGDKTKQVKSVWKWAENTWQVAFPNDADSGSDYAQSKGFGVLQEIAPGEGFWANFAE